MNKKLRLKVHAKYGGRCAYCGKAIAYKDMQVDHLNPKCLGGPNEESNLMPTCRQCNHYKRGEKLESFRESIETLHERIVKPYIHRVALDYGIMRVDEWCGRFYFEKVNNPNENEEAEQC